MVIISLLQNIALLVALAAVHQVLAARWQETRLRYEVLSGLLFGGVGLVGMMTPVQFAPGIIFDGRSIILSSAGLLGGPVVALIAGLLCVALRLWIGGPGAAMGVCVIAAAAALGVLFHHLRRRRNRPVGALWLWGFGLLVHGVMLGLIFLLPKESRGAVWRQIGWAIVLIYPVATMLVCFLFLDYETQRRTRLELEESEARHRGTLRSIGDAVIATDAAGRVVLFNPVAEAVTGWNEASARGRPLEELVQMVHEETRTAVENPVQRVLREGTAVALTSQTVLLGRDDVERPVEASGAPVRDEQGRITGVVLVFRDQSRERAAARTLRESEGRYRHLFEMESDAIVLVDNESGQVLEANPAAVALYGYSREEWLRMRHTDVSAEPEQTRRAALDHWTRVPVRWHRKKDGTPIPVEITARHFDWKGRKVHVAAIRDVSERLRATEQIRQWNLTLEERVLERTAQLKAANEELDAFSYSVSHDLRAPLRVIDGFTRILSEDHAPHLNSEGKRVAAIIRSEAKRMGQLIDDLLAFSRMQRCSIHAVEIDMTALAESVFKGCVPPASDRQIDFKLHPLPAAHGDPSMLRQVLVNLIANAIKYTRSRAVAEISVQGRKDGDELVYSVEDNGVGFDMQCAGKLFGVFQRLHPEEEFEGEGVGLALVQRIIRRHGGRVWAKAKPDEGASFYFTLPAKNGTTGTAETTKGCP